ncbi:hypothetical protein RJ640_029378 [Escallonia rubra]|uniref:DC1 domain-containing protein n=1 Tax=Escallonia rubra TaxID=112253 RepID=A0AA88RZN4_9ASTE|nr:hypothetical protein RJ640_029378 [Escallonia rubra]
MGKLDSDSIINHFSHQHPLKLLNFQPRTTHAVFCSGCKRNASGWIYLCDSCNYCLHKACTKFPETFSHDVDKAHPLVLLSSPAYPEGAFKCNGCGGSGTGFSYHCPECEIDIHPICAFMPPTIKHDSHDHWLDLCFSPPYDNKVFGCDICQGSGFNHWLYRCDTCGFDAHMKCAKNNTIQQSQPPQLTQSRSVPPQPPQLVKSRSVPLQVAEPAYDFPSWNQTSHPFSPPPPVQQQYTGCTCFHAQQANPGNGFPNRTQSFPQAGQGSQYAGAAPNLGGTAFVQNTPARSDMMSNLAGHMVQGMIDGLAQQAGQAIFDGFIDGS